MKNLNQTARLGYWAKMIYESLTPKQKWLKTKNHRGKKLYLFEYAWRRLPNF